jgi:hypothetical protein
MRTHGAPAARLLFHAISAFLVGAVAVLVVHQPVIALLHGIGVAPFSPYNWQGTAPWGVPVVLSLSFWAGVWTIPIAALLDRLPRGWPYWVGAVLLGAVPPTFTTWLVIFPLRGLPSGAFAPLVPVALVVNGAWGLGIGAMWAALRRRQSRAAIGFRSGQRPA